MSDVNEYSHSSVIVPKYFCGFIDGQNALQRHTVWNIHLKPYIKIHFLKFELFDYYWFCDYEYLRVSGNNKSATFCGNRLPWVHDAAATSVNIILMTHVQRAGTRNYQVELLYYAACVPNYNHFVVFVQPTTFLDTSPMIDIHLPNTKQNAFESFHFISRNRLDIVDLKAINTCNKGQVVCYDGPGFKSPVLQFTYKQSVWKCLSSTFQMMCKFLRVDNVCTISPRLHYRASRDPSEKLQYIGECPSYPLEINESKSEGTTKYIYSYRMVYSCMIRFIKMDISFPYMLSEGNSCMYGGVYILQWNSEILSLCTSTLNGNRHIAGSHGSLLIIIHYSEYSTERILFHAEHSKSRYLLQYIPFYRTYKEDTLIITRIRDQNDYMYSSLFRLRKIHYINIHVNKSATIEFDAQYRSPCVTVTILHPSDLSNMWFIQDHDKENGSWTMYDRTTFGHRTLRKRTFIESVVINMSACSFVRDPVWEFYIRFYSNYVQGEYFSINRYTLSGSVLEIPLSLRRMKTLWLMLHMQKPADVPVYAIWRVWINSRDAGLRAFIEVPLDHSSSWYTWDDPITSNNLSITVNKTINIVLQSNSVGIYCAYECIYGIFFTRDLHEERITKYITGQTPQQFHFSFHNQR